jgi:hypothetical protein
MGTMKNLIEATSGTGKVVGPKVNLNGTRGKDLLDQVIDAGHGVSKAMDALDDAAPHGRDYLPQGQGEYPLAAKQHADRMARLKSVYDELQQVAMLIANQL